MFLQQFTSYLLLCVILSTSFLTDVTYAYDLEALKTLKLSIDQRALTPEQQRECSMYYFPRMENISKNYDVAIDICQDTSQAAIAAAKNATEPIHNNILTMSAFLCSQVCEANFNQTNDYLELYRCYNEWATYEVNNLFSIAGNATLARNKLSADLDRIDGEEVACLVIAFEDYQLKWNAEAQAWNNCVAGNGIPTTTTSTPRSTTPGTTVETTTPYFTAPSSVQTTEDPYSSLRPFFGPIINRPQSNWSK